MLRQVPIATATIYFKRFYIKNAYCETNPYLVLAACLLVAAKVEETPVHIKSIVSEAKAVFTGTSPLYLSEKVLITRTRDQDIPS
jgi:cyclin C